MTSLQQQLNFFIYSAATSPQFITTLKKQITPAKVQHLNDSRKHMNLSVKKQQRINAQHYYEIFKMSRDSTMPEQTFRFADLAVSAHGLILNTSAFLVAIQLIGEDEQVKYWREQVLNGRVMGAYGQTELGHGSNVKQLQTVATYHPETQTFTINSPTTSSSKFWPGVLGQYCTHSVIQARTIVAGKDIGVQTFVIELRDKELNPLPNVELFDIGPKLGFQRIDNGGLYFRQLSIPRNALLSRYVKVTADGKVQGSENTQAIKYGYGSMLNLRVKLTYSFALRGIVAPACATHSLLTSLGTAELPANRKFITDSLCVGFGWVVANKHPHGIFDQLLKEIENKNYSKADKLLVSCHIISSTFKALSSRMAVDFQSAMQTMTPLGKFRTSLLPFFLLNYVPSTTYQGDNTVLLQQTSKYLLFKFNLEKELPQVAKTFNSDDMANAALALQHILVAKLKKVKSGMQGLADKGIGFQDIWNQYEQNSLIQASNLWGYLTLLQSMMIILPKIKQNSSFYTKICQGFTNYITNRSEVFLHHGFKVNQVQTWKKFSEQEFKAMVTVNGPIELNRQPMQLLSREQQWFRAKL